MTVQKRFIAKVAAPMLVLVALGCQSPGTPEPSEQPPAIPEAPVQAQQSGDPVESSADIQKMPGQAGPKDSDVKQAEPTPAETPKEAEETPGDKPVEPQEQADPDPAKTGGEQALAVKTPVKKKKEVPNRQRPRTILSGCFTNPDARQGGGMRATPGAGPGQREGVTVKARGEDAIEVRHNLTHNCCYTAKVDTKILKHLVHVTEKLSGEPCRCKCSSTIKTIIPLAKGNYSVTVDLSQEGKAKKIHEQKISL